MTILRVSRVSSIQEVPYYYLESDILKIMFNSDNFKNLTFEEFKLLPSFDFIRDQSNILNQEDFYFSLNSCKVFLLQKPVSQINDRLRRHP